MKEGHADVTLAHTPESDESVYGSAVAHESDVERARKAVQAERRAREAHLDALDARDAAVNAALASAPDDLADNELARRLELEPSTFRSITVELRRRRRAKRA